MKAYERLLKYVVVRTPSDENSETVPSSKCQFDLANILVDELKELGVEAHVDDQCYVYGKIPATPGYENCRHSFHGSPERCHGRRNRKPCPCER